MEEKQKVQTVADREKQILDFWNKNNIFKKSELGIEKKGNFLSRLFKSRKHFYFYDGPPFATGLPHFGHMLPGTIKDVIPRYKTMKGYIVTRNWGWDCHGLPLEIEVEKELGIKSKKEIEEYGIEKFNAIARNSVFKYADEWKRIIPRFGRWVDMENDYKTLSASYMESEWSVFNKLYENGYVERGFKMQHICPRCSTSLSNTEVSNEYKMLTDTSVYILFPASKEDNTYFVAWTTTPWTLLGNAALAVNKDLNYSTVEKDGKKYIVHESKVDLIEGGNVIETKKGSSYVGSHYIPPFDDLFIEEIKEKNNLFKVYAAPYVNADTGTGIVHLAPPYGEEDFEFAKENKIPIKHHVNLDGTIVSNIKEFAGNIVKKKGNHQEFDKLVIEELKKRKICFRSEDIEHSYPVCWRCSTPLLNYATSSWFIRADKYKDKMSAANKKVNWVPSYIRDGRFGNWLADAKEWSVSRARYWGTPIPVWTVKKTGEHMIISSISEMANKMKSKNRFTFIRHAETFSNVKRVFSQDDVQLTKNGINNTTEYAKKMKVKPTIIFCSPLKRTRQTAEIIAKITGAEVIENALLKEIKVGPWMGKNIDDYRAELKKLGKKDITKQALDGTETALETYNRIIKFLEEADSKYDNSDIIVVTHGRCLRCVDSIGYTLFEFENNYLKNLKNRYKNLKEVKVDYKHIKRDENGEVDIHRPYIDNIVLYDKDNNPAYNAKEVFDCWFESGSMPYGSQHYPFNKDGKFDPINKVGFPADFICEGLDQTRGWFYSLMAIGVGAYNVSPYKNVIVTGLVLAKDGRKMSKSLKNYSDPLDTVEKFGADSLRHFLLNSLATKGQDVSFKDEYVSEVYKKVYSRLNNCFNFYKPYANLPHNSGSKHVLDIYILSRLFQLVDQMVDGFETYNVSKAVSPIGDFIEDFSIWYLRSSRDRIRSESEDGGYARETMKTILTTLAKAIAPIAPFYTEYLYREMALLHNNDKEYKAESVHLCEYPNLKNLPFDSVVLKEMNLIRSYASIAHEKRSSDKIKVRQPLNSVTIPKNVSEASSKILADEINVKKVIIDTLVNEVSLDLNLTDDLKVEGFVRELIRAIQSVRKNNKFSIIETVPVVNLKVEKHIKESLNPYIKEIKDSVRVGEIKFVDTSFTDSEEHNVNGETISISFSNPN